MNKVGPYYPHFIQKNIRGISKEIYNQTYGFFIETVNHPLRVCFIIERNLRNKYENNST